MMLWIADRLLVINLCWNVVLCLGFFAAGKWAMGLYFFGAFILTLALSYMY